MNKKEGIQLMEKIIYELPYIIEQHYQHPRKTVKAILDEKNAIMKGKSKSAKETLCREIENAYLSKEIERMYERLAKAGRDTALVSDKLNDLKKRHIKE